MDSISSIEIAPFGCDDHCRWARRQVGAMLGEAIARVCRLATYGDQTTGEGADQSENLPTTWVDRSLTVASLRREHCRLVGGRAALCRQSFVAAGQV
jgi:hypothetical protein